MENISTGLKWAIGVILTLLIIAAGIGVYLVASGYWNRAHEQTSSQSHTLSSAEFNQYDNKDVTGQDVIDAATRYQDRPQFSVHVITGVNNSAGYYPKNNYTVCYATPGSGNPVNVSGPSTCSAAGQTVISSMSDPSSSSTYVNPTGIFAAQIYKDSNQEVRLIEFRQK